MALRIDVLTIFPEMFAPVLGSSILQRAQDQGQVRMAVHNLRDYTHDKRRTVDDRPYGGGAGMVMRPEPIFEAVEAIEAACHAEVPRDPARCQIILLSPAGQPLTHALANELSGCEHLLLICGRYEGVDERVRSALVQREISIGDYVVTGGELPAMVVIDCVTRLVPGVLGDEQSALEESFSAGLLEYPQYTRPAEFRGMTVPDVLLTGNHSDVAAWRQRQAVAKTKTRRPDLLRGTSTTENGAE